MARKTEGSFSDLFMDNSLSDEESVTTLRLSEIEPNKNQPRKSFDSDALKQLADSIVEHGVIQPLLVRSLPSGNYVIIAGERRWRAAKMAGLSEIPVVIRDDISDEQAAQIAMIENLQRENLNPIEEALGYKEIIDKHGLTQDKLARALGKARSSIANSLGLLAMPNGVQELLRQGLLSAGHCKALKKVKDEALMIELAHKAANGELSVRQVEQIAKRESENVKAAEKSREIKPRLSYYTEVEASLTEQFGTKVHISEGKKGNVLQINFKDKEELENILAHFQEN
ncbi:MAG: ParB/RepB/Spo0J family partition protein [Oscillospiraceae bacterium]|nr:ParB/RepB/Spo0J family partition protein [Oscillospiraceae bacterium]